MLKRVPDWGGEGGRWSALLRDPATGCPGFPAISLAPGTARPEIKSARQARRGRRSDLRNLPFHLLVGGGSGADELKTNRGRSLLLQKLCRTASSCPPPGKNTDRNQARTSLLSPNWNPLQHPQLPSARTIETTPLR